MKWKYYNFWFNFYTKILNIFLRFGNYKIVLWLVKKKKSLTIKMRQCARTSNM